MIPVLARFSFHFHTSKKKLNLFVVLVFRYSVAMVLKFRNRLVHHFEKRRKRCRRKKEVHLETSDGRRGTYKKAKKKSKQTAGRCGQLARLWYSAEALPYS